MPFPWIPVLFATTAALSFMGSMRTMQTMNTAAQWEKYNQKINTSYKTIIMKARLMLWIGHKK